MATTASACSRVFGTNTGTSTDGRSVSQITCGPLLLAAVALLLQLGLRLLLLRCCRRTRRRRRRRYRGGRRHAGKDGQRTAAAAAAALLSLHERVGRAVRDRILLELVVLLLDVVQLLDGQVVVGAGFGRRAAAAAHRFAAGRLFLAANGQRRSFVENARLRQGFLGYTRGKGIGFARRRPTGRGQSTNGGGVVVVSRRR